VGHTYAALCGWMGCAGAERGFIVNRRHPLPHPSAKNAYGWGAHNGIVGGPLGVERAGAVRFMVADGGETGLR